jgi:hypothetical protein
MLGIVPFSQGLKRVLVSGPSVHRAQHTSDEFVDPETLLDEGYERRDPAFIIGRTAEIGENELLE